MAARLDPQEEALVSAMLVASRALVAVAARSLTAAPADVTLVQYRVLVVLASRGPQSPSALAAELRASPSSITRLCDRLEQKALLTRHHEADNRRQVTAAITTKGRRVVDAVTKARRAELATLMEAVPANRRSAIIRALNDLASAAGEAPDEAWAQGWNL